MKLRRRVGVCLLLAALLVAAGLVISAVPSLRWRATVARLKATGRLPELSWIELSRMLLAQAARTTSKTVATVGSGYGGVRNPPLPWQRGPGSRTPGIRRAVRHLLTATMAREERRPTCTARRP